MTRCFADDTPMPALATAALFVETFLCLTFFVCQNISPWVDFGFILCFFCCLFPHLFI